MTYAVILAGGWGERLWPMSTRARPKQLLSIAGESTLVGNTLLRIATLVSLPDALVMTSGALKERIVEERPGRRTPPRRSPSRRSSCLPRTPTPSWSCFPRITLSVTTTASGPR